MSDSGDTPTSARDERLSVPGSEILEHDIWADEPETCPSCGGAVDADSTRCSACGQWLERCGRSCPSCASPRCVGGERAENTRPAQKWSG